jgi:hypothetical protein
VVDLRFVSALQALLSLALAQREGVELRTSSELAEGLATDPPLVLGLSAEMEDAVLAGLGTRTLADPLGELDEADRLRKSRGSKSASHGRGRGS